MVFSILPSYLGYEHRVALPFCKVALRAKKPLSAAYPKELKTVGDHLRRRWLELKLLQEDVAERLGTTPCTLRNWEKNMSSLSLAFIPKIIRFLGYVPYDTSSQHMSRDTRNSEYS